MSERIEMLVVGDELLDGRVTDTNSVHLAARLNERRVTLAQRTTVIDDVDSIVREARAIVARGTRLCVVSGGLGPTADDLTSASFAALSGAPLCRDEQQVAVIVERLARRGRSLSENQLKQADRPAGSTVIPNPRGTAPGFALVHEGCRFVVLPGVPHEFEAMLEGAVLDDFGTREHIEQRALYTFGLIEAEVDARLTGVRGRFPGVRFGFRAHFPEIHVSLKAPAAQAKQLEQAWVAAQDALGDHVYASEPRAFAEVVLASLREHRATLAVAESCTGGLVSDKLTNVPGSSDVLVLSVVAYANQAKQALLGVKEETLAEHGAVSEATVIEMASGVRERIGATFGLATSGIAGPGGGTTDKPVGTVWIALVGDQLRTARKLQLPFDRRGNKVVSTYAVLDLLRRHLCQARTRRH